MLMMYRYIDILVIEDFSYSIALVNEDVETIFVIGSITLRKI